MAHSCAPVVGTGCLPGGPRLLPPADCCLAAAYRSRTEAKCKAKVHHGRRLRTPDAGLAVAVQRAEEDGPPSPSGTQSVQEGPEGHAPKHGLQAACRWPLTPASGGGSGEGAVRLVGPAKAQRGAHQACTARNANQCTALRQERRAASSDPAGLAAGRRGGQHCFCALLRVGIFLQPCGEIKSESASCPGQTGAAGAAQGLQRDLPLPKQTQHAPPHQVFTAKGPASCPRPCFICGSALDWPARPPGPLTRSAGW